MILSSHQPDFLPYMGVIYKFYKSDKVVISDDVEYSKSNMHNYNYVKTPHGKLKISLPVSYHTGDYVNRVLIRKDDKHIKKLLKTIKMSYGKAPYFNDIYPVFKSIIEKDYKYLWEYNYELIRWILYNFGIKNQYLLSSKLDLKQNKGERIIEMATKLKADKYYAGKGAFNYIEHTFDDSTIELVMTDYEPIQYQQRFEGFIENLSVLDYIMNEGFNIPKEWRK